MSTLNEGALFFKGLSVISTIGIIAAIYLGWSKTTQIDALPESQAESFRVVGRTTMYRIRVPSGWIVDYTTTNHAFFVPDPAHEWKLEGK